MHIWMHLHITQTPPSCPCPLEVPINTSGGPGETDKGAEGHWDPTALWGGGALRYLLQLTPDTQPVGANSLPWEQIFSCLLEDVEHFEGYSMHARVHTMTYTHTYIHSYSTYTETDTHTVQYRHACTSSPQCHVETVQCKDELIIQGDHT